MKAAVIVQHGSDRTLQVQEVAAPQPGPGEILVRVRAAGLNRADLALLPHGPASGYSGPAIPGMEMAGEVVGLGSGVSAWRVGDRVMAMAPRAYAQQVTVDARWAMPVPEGCAWEHAAAMPLAMMTAHDALIVNGRMRTGDAVLIQGVSSGVGIAALQIAKARGASVVIGTSTSEAKLARLAPLGLNWGVNTRKDALEPVVQKATDSRGVDVVVDFIGAPALDDNMKALAVKGRLVQVGRLGGVVAPGIDLNLLSLKRLQLIGVTFRTRTPEEVASLVATLQADLGGDIDALKYQPLVDREFSLADVAQAHEHMKQNSHLGKIVLRVP